MPQGPSEELEIIHTGGTIDSADITENEAAVGGGTLGIDPLTGRLMEWGQGHPDSSNLDATTLGVARLIEQLRDYAGFSEQHTIITHGWDELDQ